MGIPVNARDEYTPVGNRRATRPAPAYRRLNQTRKSRVHNQSGRVCLM